jgi:hypothetical protein
MLFEKIEKKAQQKAQSAREVYDAGIRSEVDGVDGPTPESFERALAELGVSIEEAKARVSKIKMGRANREVVKQLPEIMAGLRAVDAAEKAAADKLIADRESVQKEFDDTYEKLKREREALNQRRREVEFAQSWINGNLKQPQHVTRRIAELNSQRQSLAATIDVRFGTQLEQLKEHLQKAITTRDNNTTFNEATGQREAWAGTQEKVDELQRQIDSMEIHEENTRKQLAQIAEELSKLSKIEPEE